MRVHTSFRDLKVWRGEVHTQLELGPRLGYCDQQLIVPVQGRLEEIGKMLNGLITSLQPSDDW